MPHYPRHTEYSDKYYDDIYEYRHVTLSQPDFHRLPQSYVSFYDPHNLKKLHQARQNASSVDYQGGHQTPMQLLSENEWRMIGVQ